MSTLPVSFALLSESNLSNLSFISLHSMPLSDSSPTFSPSCTVGSSASRSHKLYSRRSKVIARKRQAEVDAESSTDESGGEPKGTTGIAGKRRKKQNSASPSPADSSQHPADAILVHKSQSAGTERPPATPPRQIRPLESTRSSQGSPRNLSALFHAAASPSSDSSLGQKRRGKRQMLTKAQSLGDNEASGRSPSAPSTPSRMPRRSVSMSESTASPIGALPLPAEEPLTPASRAKRTYGSMRSYIDVADSNAGNSETEDRQTYAELRGRYEVDSGSARVNLLPVSLNQAKLTLRTFCKPGRLSRYPT